MLSSIRNVNREKINGLPTWSNIVIFDSGIFLGSKIRITPPRQKPYPLRRHIPIWLIYGSTPSGKSPYSYQVFKKNTLSYIERKLVSILQ